MYVEEARQQTPHRRQDQENQSNESNKDSHKEIRAMTSESDGWLVTEQQQLENFPLRQLRG